MTSENLTSRPWLLSKRVLPQHTDHGGVMWHGAYLSWLEEARVEALAAVGLTYRELCCQGMQMPVVRLEIKYLRSLAHGETVSLESWSLPKKGARWPWKTVIIREDGEMAVQALVELVLVHQVGGLSRVLRQPPESLALALRKLQLGP